MWSKIQDTPLAREVQLILEQNRANGCTYHNSEHVNAMYQYLEESEQPYSETLDWAVLFHDSVYDAQPYKESRSAALFLELRDEHSGFGMNDLAAVDVCSLILDTNEHLVSTMRPLESSAIIRADLHALTSAASTIRNYVLLLEEACNLYKTTDKQTAKASQSFMFGLQERVRINSRTRDTAHAAFYRKVLDGISLTIHLSEEIINE